MNQSQTNIQSRWAALVREALAIPGTPPGQHLDAATAQAYAQERLGPEALAAAEAHLAACPRCAGRMQLVVEIWECLLAVARSVGQGFDPERRFAELCGLTDPDRLAAAHARWRLAKGLADWAAAVASAAPLQAIQQWVAELDRELSVGWAVLLQGAQQLAGLAARTSAAAFEVRRLALGIGDSPAAAQLQVHLQQAADQLQAGRPDAALQELTAASRCDARAVQSAEMELLHQGRRVGLVLVDGRRRTVQVKTFGGAGGIRPVLAVLLPEHPEAQVLGTEFNGAQRSARPTNVEHPQARVLVTQFRPISGEEPNRLAVFEQVPDGCFWLAVGPVEPASS